jgi:RND family efflux transporter MFP subunit
MHKHALVYVIAVAISLLLTACNENRGAEQRSLPPVPVSSYQAKLEKASYYDEYPGTVTPLNQVELRPQVSGYVTDIYFKDGQHITKGMKLYAIDQQRYRSAYDQALADLNVAKANMVKSQEDADRYNDLAKSDAIAKQTLDHARADLEAAKMQVAAAEANVQNVQTNLLYSVISAPFDGTIGISSVKLGSAVTAGQTLLNTISSDDPMAVDCSVDEKEIGLFARLLQEGNNIKDSTFSIVLPDQSIYPYLGRLTVMDRSVDPQTGTIRIRVTFPNPTNVLRAGLTCNLRVLQNNLTESLLIPYKAVIEQMGEYFVFVINGNRVSEKKVELGMQIRDMVIVKSGLQPSQEIVTEGVQKLRDNGLVAITTAQPNAGMSASQSK